MPLLLAGHSSLPYELDGDSVNASGPGTGTDIGTGVGMEVLSTVGTWGDEWTGAWAVSEASTSLAATKGSITHTGQMAA